MFVKMETEITVLVNSNYETLKKELEKADIEYTHTSTVINKKVTPVNRKKEVFHKLREFSNCSLVITDRLHAMIFSALMGTPCIAFDNVSKKVSGVYKWIEKLDYIKCIETVLTVDLINAFI